MPFKSLFKGLFGGNETKQAPVIRSINITESGLEIDGRQVDILSHISELEEIFGKARATGFKTDSDSREFLEELHGKGMVTKRVNYTWDELGIYCYTDNGTVASSIGIRLSKDSDVYKYTPKKVFTGTVTIEGRPWFQVISNGEDMEFFRKYEMGALSIVSEYADPFYEGERTESGYVDLEISIRIG